MDRWKKGFIDNAGPTEPATFPFVCLGNKLDQESERQVPTTKGQAWAREENNMMFYETSAVEGIHVDEAFANMAKAALKRESESQMSMPSSIADAGGALKLTQKEHS